MRILGIETSCDETATAVVENGTRVLSTVVASSASFHEKTGGVVPEVAARKQLEYIIPVIKHALKEAGAEGKDLDAVAVTVGPGLVGSLLVGAEAAKSLAFAWDKPLVPVNHLVGHIYGNFVEVVPPLPAAVLIVSGGHTDLVLMKNHGDLQYLGSTLDDAAGESFDKVARLLGISMYLGGASLSMKAAEAREEGSSLRSKDDPSLPRPLLHKPGYDFSFSGLKTAVRRLVDAREYSAAAIACEFEDAVIEVLVKKTIKAACDFGVHTILLGGGVAANSRLRSEMKSEADKARLSLFIPSPALCTDNAVTIASAAYFNYNPVPISEIKVDPSLSIVSSSSDRHQ